MKYLTTNDLRGLVMEISRIGQEIPKFLTVDGAKEFFEKSDLSGTKMTQSYIEDVVKSEIEKIWPLVDDIVIDAAIETKESVWDYFEYFFESIKVHFLSNRYKTPAQKFSDETLKVMIEEEVAKLNPILEDLVSSVESLQVFFKRRDVASLFLSTLL